MDERSGIARVSDAVSAQTVEATMEEIGKLLVLFGALFLLIGAALWLLSKIPGREHLPGDIVIQSGNMACLFPIATSILLSIVLTIVLTYHSLNRLTKTEFPGKLQE
jgi:hypothetical protein